MTQPILEPYVQAKLVQRYGLRGGFQLRLDEVLVPTVAVDDLVEEASVRAAMGGGDHAGVAAQNSHIQLLNPAGSGVLVELYQLAITNGAALAPDTIHFLRGAPNTLAGVLATAWTDFRGPPGPALAPNVPRAQVRDQSNAGLIGTGMGSIRLAVGEYTLLPLRVVITPDTSLILASDSVNTLLSVQFFWRERDLLGNE